MDRQQIISLLVEARLEKNISQAELARRIKTQRSNIHRFESGVQNPSLDMIIRIAEALGFEFSVVLNHKEEKNMVYELKLYDESLIVFSMEKKGLEGLVIEIISINEAKKHLFPLELDVCNEGILKWLQKRMIPKNRRFVDEILQSLDLSLQDIKGIIDVCKGLSLNDSYWIVPKGFEGTFAQYNLYENPFSEILSLIAYTGVGYGKDINSTSPEFTTNGMLPKAWRFFDKDSIYLYKGGSEGASNAGREPYCEYYASQIAQQMKLNAVIYDLENWKGITASKCKLFNDIDTSFIPIGRLVRTGGILACIQYYDSLGKEYGEQIRSMLIFDALILNEDRHFGNFGLLKDNHSGKIVQCAPIFDNGLSLLCYAGTQALSSYEEFEKYALTRTTPYHLSFDEIAVAIIGPIQKRQLKAMIGFKFKRHPLCQLNDKHIEYLEIFIQKRIRKLLALPSIKR